MESANYPLSWRSFEALDFTTVAKPIQAGKGLKQASHCSKSFLIGFFVDSEWLLGDNIVALAGRP
jgi:hypothetical protein